MTLAVEDVSGLEEAVRQAASGQEMLVTRAGKPIAKLVPLDQSGADEREASLERFREMMAKGFDLGGLKIDRDELYDRVR